MTLVTIAQASAMTGVSAKMIRHYESIGLIKAPLRTENRYRHYSEAELHELGFIRRSRDLGFSFEDIRQLLSLWRDKGRSSAEVKAIALRHIEELDQKAAALGAMSRTLKHLAATCHGDDRPDCPILDALDHPKKADSFSDP
ncbi:Cu(I)-responsive transcriptional regulator [Acidocella aminolytica]|uniref:Transcriptional regulator MerR n=1 Tax=Acidocella aminolytica 101 = DSM 11237 TaxID=1120923 RepID=A0A0D6PJF3_9PROT|nr:Cu(I)-responsive transcriptional regulator [Acidocella aminolytica]GAN81546.1 transcriptional regulator MerR [Acidocella aminolytica 101 = DSM 11237]GBQ41558.1 transcriptional regulator [Acidocella aminolytica 101 = DSM 11237]SHF12506.1 Cu(I)-responsive transcriptional regulator [Acidocella aminolytica 101 = DSM 11237]